MDLKKRGELKSRKEKKREGMLGKVHKSVNVSLFRFCGVWFCRRAFTFVSSSLDQGVLSRKRLWK